MTVAVEGESKVPEPKKETAGKQVQDFLAKQDGYQYEAGEVLECMFKDLEKIMTDILKKNQDVPEYYIVTQTDRIPWMGNAMHLRTWWRKSRPVPQAKQDVYKVTNPGSKLECQWSIPFPANCKAICANPKNYDPQLSKWVIDFIKGELK